ncbi:MAG: flagellar motor protein MotB [Filomicrobium sp.]
MAVEDDDVAAQEIVIVKRKGGGGEDGHGSTAWKIAFADFMTAMMALFLVLWLTNATDEKTKKQIATYFNPIELTADTASQKGVKTLDKENTKEPRDLPDRVRNSPTGTKGEGIGNLDSGKAHVDKQLFTDPYDVVRQLSAQTQVKGIGAKKEDDASPVSGTAVNQGDAFRDPFDPVFRSETVALAKDLDAGDAKASQAAKGKGEWDKLSVEAKKLEKKAAAEKALKAELKREARLVHAAIKKAVDGVAGAKLPNINVTVDKEGVLISLTDKERFGMFASASSDAGKELTDLMGKIGDILKATAGKIVVRGHTDARPFRAVDNDNWRLSMGRAYTAYGLLVNTGIPESRFEKIEGYADKKLRDKRDPNSAVNRRIEILLRRAPT